MCRQHNSKTSTVSDNIDNWHWPGVVSLLSAVVARTWSLSTLSCCRRHKLVCYQEAPTTHPQQPILPLSGTVKRPWLFVALLPMLRLPMSSIYNITDSTYFQKRSQWLNKQQNAVLSTATLRRNFRAPVLSIWNMKGSSGGDMKCLKLRKADALVRSKWWRLIRSTEGLMMIAGVNVSDCFWYQLTRVIPD